MAEQISGHTGDVVPEQQNMICIHTNKITDVCLDKDCIEDLRVYLTADSQEALNCSAGARIRSVELLQVYINVEELGFQRGYYAVDLTFYYRVCGEATAKGNRIGALDGVSVFSKRVVLYGGECGTKLFSSRGCSPARIGAWQLPEAIVEVVDPMVLSSKVLEACTTCPRELTEIPDEVREVFGQELVLDSSGRCQFVTIGQFSTIRLERDAQLCVPDGCCCVPQKTCCGEAGCQEDPCDIFSRIDFPYQAFYPNKKHCEPHECECGENG